MALRADSTFCAVLLAAALCGAAAACERAGDDGAEPYKPGQGLVLGATCATLGGYASLQYQHAGDGGRRAALSDLSIFFWWEGDSPLKFFSEFDSHGAFSAERQAEPGEGRYPALERAYFDYVVNDGLTLRAGKYLTPIGRWNQVHAAPLVWSTSRPLITHDIFPDNASGLMALGNVPLPGLAFDYTVYATLGQEARPAPGQEAFGATYGARLNVGLDANWQLGLSYARFGQSAPGEQRKRLAGLDFLWADKGYELSGESVYRFAGAGPERAVQGGFLQAVAPLGGALAGVLRLETLRGPAPTAARRLVLGLNYHSSRAVALKLELIGGRNADAGAPFGLLSSVSVLF